MKALIDEEDDDMRMLRACLIVGATLVLMFGPTTAQSHLLGHHDPDDTSGIDLRFVGVSRYAHNGHARFALEVTLHDREVVYGVEFAFDTRGGPAPDRYAVIGYDGASGGIYNAQLLNGHRELIQMLHTSSDCGSCERTYPVTGPWKALRATRHIRWRVVASDDRAPDAGWYEH